MTGEITLSGLVLPVGGIREKALAARRHGLKTFVLPALNRPDLAEAAAEVREDMHVRAGVDARGRAERRAAAHTMPAGSGPAVASAPNPDW